MARQRRTPVRTQANPAGRSSTPNPPPMDMSKLKLKMTYRDISDIKNYDYNARDNAQAVAAVAKSIQTFGFLIPVVIDADDVLAAGHTRVAAALSLGMLEVPTIQVDHLTPEQINAFRLIDNKVAELADWDYNLLSSEVNELKDLFDFTDYGWNQSELDCLSSMASDDCLSTASLNTPRMEERGGSTAQGRRAPTRARMVLGELVFFEEADTYRNWMQGLRELHNFDEEAIVEDLKRRLGILV